MGRDAGRHVVRIPPSRTTSVAVQYHHTWGYSRDFSKPRTSFGLPLSSRSCPTVALQLKKRSVEIPQSQVVLVSIPHIQVRIDDEGVCTPSQCACATNLVSRAPHMLSTLEAQGVDRLLGKGASEKGFEFNVTAQGKRKTFGFRYEGRRLNSKEAWKLARRVGVTYPPPSIKKRRMCFSSIIKLLVLEHDGWREQTERGWQRADGKPIMTYVKGDIEARSMDEAIRLIPESQRPALPSWCKPPPLPDSVNRADPNP